MIWGTAVIKAVSADCAASGGQGGGGAGGAAHPELLLQRRAARGVGREDAVDVSVQLRGGHLCLSAQNVLHQSVVDENVLLLGGRRRRGEECANPYIYIRWFQINGNMNKRLAIMSIHPMWIFVIDLFKIAAEEFM